MVGYFCNGALIWLVPAYNRYAFFCNYIYFVFIESPFGGFDFAKHRENMGSGKTMINLGGGRRFFFSSVRSKEIPDTFLDGNFLTLYVTCSMAQRSSWFYRFICKNKNKLIVLHRMVLKNTSISVIIGRPIKLV